MTLDLSVHADDDRAPDPAPDDPGRVLVRGCRVIASSGCHRYPYWNEQFLFDGRRTTGWCTPSRLAPQPEFLVVDMGRPRRLCGMRLLSRAINPDAGFPGTITISADGRESPVARLEGIRNRVDLWHAFDWSETTARRVRLDFGDIGRRPEGKYFLQFMCLELYARV